MARTYKSKRNPTGYPDFTLPIGLLMQLIPVKLVPDWGAIEAEDIELQGCASAPTATSTLLLSYTVPAGKTLLIYHWAAVNASSEYAAYYHLYNSTDMFVLSYGTGYRGFQTSFGKPIRMASGKTVAVYGTQGSGVSQVLCAHVGGVLI